MGMSDFYGPAEESESIATIHDALDAGITLLDTGDYYGMGRNELLLRDALKGRREKAFICVKFGAQRAPDRSWLGNDTRPNSVKNFLAHTLTRLGTDYVDLYQPGRVDPNVPIEDTVGAIADLVKAGYVRHLGLSEASAATIRRAHAVHPVAALQVEYSLVTRDIEAETLPALRELGISVVCYGVLSRGLLASSSPKARSRADSRQYFPRFQADNVEKNLGVVKTLESLAAEIGASAVQLALAWVLHRGQDIVPLIGARRRPQLHEALGALSLRLTPQDMSRIEARIPGSAIAGTRYPADAMSTVNR